MSGAGVSASVVLVGGARTTVGRLGGRWAGVPATELGGRAVAGALQRAGEPEVDHVLLANVVQAGNGQNPARRAAQLGGVARTVPGATLNDVCLASLTAVAHGALLLRAGEARTVLVGGFDSMSTAPREPVDLLVRDGLWCSLEDVGMGPLSDRANRDLAVSRADQDAYAVESHRRAAAATDARRLADELVPDETRDGVDEGIRRDSTPERVARLAPAFTDDGTITAANASQMSDAGAAGVLTTRELADAEGRPVLAEVVGSAVVAGPDSSLHLRPAEAAERLLAAHGLAVDDVALWEVNEAFAGVVLASQRRLGVDLDRVNVNGGAIALGHPLGASGFRLVLTLAHELRRRGEELGVATMCGGGGQGRAVLLRAA